MEGKSRLGVVIGLSVLGAALVGGIVYFVFKKKTSAKDALDAKAKLDAAKKKYESIKGNKNVSSTEKTAASEAIKLAANKVKDLLTKNPTKKGSNGTLPKNPSTGENIKILSTNAYGEYVREDNPYVLYSDDGNEVGFYDDNLGFFVDTDGTPIATEDGTPIIDYYLKCYQDIDGIWWTKNGYIVNGSPYDKEISFWNMTDSEIFDTLKLMEWNDDEIYNYLINSRYNY